ncbi:sensor histidine kinase [Streptomyces sp. UNOC14_S4]|uniref:sensor histidine kinase n=1 Tax=Streptomyces sp. UNOC14_S4 TaxID=2872340 RepID=UPI0035B489E0
MTKRLVGVLRGLREDLWTLSAPPSDREGPDRQPPSGWVVWRPAVLLPVTLFAAAMFIGSTNVLVNSYEVVAGLALPYAGVQSAALVLAFYRPVPAWWATTLVMVATAWIPAPLHGARMFPWTGPGLTLQAAALFLVALRCRPRTAGTALLVSAVLGLLCGLPHGPVRSGTLFALALLAVVTVVGVALRGLHAARTQLVVQEELTAEERARRTLLEERNRIARELHDVVAHHMSVISIQAQVAPHLAENPSDALRENLAGIRQNAVEALTELRRVLGVLRSEDAAADGVRHAPQPTLDRLGELVGNVRGAGLRVTTATAGERRPLAPGVELSAFRIVQEALSNAMRHAPGAEVRVELAYRPDSLTVRVVNTRPERAAPPSPGVGHGLLGMGERAAMLGGELAAGATPDGGYEVTAILPTNPAAADPAEDIR